MPESLIWQSELGHTLLDNIVKKRIPSWKDGLKEKQREVVARILDCQDVFWIAATGDGKSAAFQVPPIVHDEISRHPELYPGWKAKKDAVTVVVTPTKGLAQNIVQELNVLGVTAFAYTHANLTKARDEEKRDVVDEIKNCLFSVICVDPEHLKKPEWTTIPQFPKFRDNLISAGAEEAHLIDEWGNSDFRPDFKLIGTLLRARFPSTISVFALSATVEPGASEASICKHLGFKSLFFHLVRSSNERPNIQFDVEQLTHGLGGEEFPQLLPYLATGRKTIIHCQTLEVVYRVYVYLIQFLDDNYNSLHRIRVYHSLCSDKYNAQTLDLLENDPYCQVCIATVAFANGINVRSLLISILLGISSTLNIDWQKLGRVGRDPNTMAQGILMVSSNTISKAQKCIIASQENPSTSIPMNHAMALLLAETVCYIACVNRIYKNQPLEETGSDCVTARRNLRCSLCRKREGATVTFAPSPIPTPFPSQPPLSSSSMQKSVLELTKKERDRAGSLLEGFVDVVWVAESVKETNQYRPKEAFFSLAVRKCILDDFLHISSREYLAKLLDDWPFISSQVQPLYDLILSELIALQDSRRKKQLATSKQRRKGKKVLDSESEGDAYISDDIISESELVHSPKRTAPPPSDITNTPTKRPRPKPKPRTKPQGMKEVMDSLSAPRTSYRRTQDENIDNTILARRSARLNTGTK